MTASRFLPDSLKTSTPEKQPGTIRQHLEYPENNKSVLYPFFNHLKNLKTSNELKYPLFTKQNS